MSEGMQTGTYASTVRMQLEELTARIEKGVGTVTGGDLSTPSPKAEDGTSPRNGVLGAALDELDGMAALVMRLRACEEALRVAVADFSSNATR